MLCMMSSTLWFVRPVLFSVLMIVCLCLVCSNRAGCECRGGSVFGGWVSLLQQVPKTNRGISGKWSLLCFSEKLLSTSGTKLRLLEDATPPPSTVYLSENIYILGGNREHISPIRTNFFCQTERVNGALKKAGPGRSRAPKQHTCETSPAGRNYGVVTGRSLAGPWCGGEILLPRLPRLLLLL